MDLPIHPVFFYIYINSRPRESALFPPFPPPFSLSLSLPLSLSLAAAMAMDGSGEDDRLVVSFGEMLIDFVPTVSGVSLAEAPGFIKAPGGAPANVAIAVSRLGGRSAFMGKLGDDEFGRMLASILRDNGVSDAGVTFDAGARTALAFVTLRSDGEREFMFYRNPSADMLLTPDELDLDLIRRVRLIFIFSLPLLSFSFFFSFFFFLSFVIFFPVSCFSKYLVLSLFLFFVCLFRGTLLIVLSKFFDGLFLRFAVVKNFHEVQFLCIGARFRAF